MGNIENELKTLIQTKYKSLRDFSFKIKMPYTTLDSIFKRGIANSSISNIISICEELGISADALASNAIIEVIKKEKPVTDYDDGVKMLDAELVKMLRNLTPDETREVRAFVRGLKTRKE